VAHTESLTMTEDQKRELLKSPLEELINNFSEILIEKGMQNFAMIGKDPDSDVLFIRHFGSIFWMHGAGKQISLQAEKNMCKNTFGRDDE